jgi:hypothetical protein
LNQVPAVDYFYSAAEHHLRGALWPSFALALILGAFTPDQVYFNRLPEFLAA